jgi:hypothetical protein
MARAKRGAKKATSSKSKKKTAAKKRKTSSAKKKKTSSAKKKTSAAKGKKKTSAAKKKKTSAAKSKKKTSAAKSKKKTAAKGKKKTSAAKGKKKTSAAKGKKKTPAKKKTPKKTTRGKGKKRISAAALRKRRADVKKADATLFAPLTHGERADAIRILTEDKRLSQMTKVGRYRVISVEPVAVKPPQKLSGNRLARLVVYDYAGDRCVDGCVNLDTSEVAHLGFSKAQPMLAREEEAAAISIAMADEQLSAELSLGDEPQVAMHYWSNNDTELAFSRRSAAVIFGPPGARPSVVAVIDLVDNCVAEVVPASQW